MSETSWLRLGIAVALGLLIGLERERSKGVGQARRAAGVRTFALATLLGALSFYVGGIFLLVAVVLAIAAFSGLSYSLNRNDDPGLTTEVGLVLAPVIGGCTMIDPVLSAATAAVVAVLFAAKVPLHAFISGVLTEAEMVDGLIFAVATLAIWPHLPNRYMGPFDALNPHNIWLLFVLMLAISASGYIAARVFGTRYGLALAGLASGFVSSTATIGSMAGLAARSPAALDAAVAGAAFSSVATPIQLALLLFAISKPDLRVMAPSLFAAGLAALIYAFFFAFRAPRTKDDLALGRERPLRLMTALSLVTTIAGMMLLTAFLKSRFGDAGVLAGAAVAGLIDAHSAALSVASLSASGRLEAHLALWPILIAFTTNALSKIVVAATTGFGRFAIRLIPGIVISTAAAWLAGWLVPV